MFERYIRKNRHYIAALAKRAIVYCSLFRLKRSSYRVSECRVAWNISLRDQHARQSHTLVSPPTCSLFSEVLNFIFNPLSVVSRRDKWRIFFLWFYILAAPAASRCAVKKKRERKRKNRCSAVSLATYSRDDYASVIDNRNDIISGKEISNASEEYYWYRRPVLLFSFFSYHLD